MGRLLPVWQLASSSSSVSSKDNSCVSRKDNSCVILNKIGCSLSNQTRILELTIRKDQSNLNIAFSFC